MARTPSPPLAGRWPHSSLGGEGPPQRNCTEAPSRPWNGTAAPPAARSQRLIRRLPASSEGGWSLPRAQHQRELRAAGRAAGRVTHQPHGLHSVTYTPLPSGALGTQRLPRQCSRLPGQCSRGAGSRNDRPSRAGLSGAQAEQEAADPGPLTHVLLCPGRPGAACRRGGSGGGRRPQPAELWQLQRQSGSFPLRGNLLRARGLQRIHSPPFSVTQGPRASSGASLSSSLEPLPHQGNGPMWGGSQPVPASPQQSEH